ncbi:hypothetical protein ACJX0J_013424, partial [Zea mays]
CCLNMPTPLATEAGPFPDVLCFQIEGLEARAKKKLYQQTTIFLKWHLLYLRRDIYVKKIEKPFICMFVSSIAFC